MDFKLAIVLVIGVQLCASLPALTPATCECPRQLRPVCGSDGITYNNKCLFQCARDASAKPIYIVNKGDCRQNMEVGGICGCSVEYIPACGTDGRTYPNTCHIGCEKAINPALDIAHEGECEKNNCFCATVFEPVCGNDGITYSNACLLNCATARDSTLRIAYNSACTE